MVITIVVVVVAVSIVVVALVFYLLMGRDTVAALGHGRRHTGHGTQDVGAQAKGQTNAPFASLLGIGAIGSVTIAVVVVVVTVVDVVGIGGSSGRGQSANVIGAAFGCRRRAYRGGRRRIGKCKHSVVGVWLFPQSAFVGLAVAVTIFELEEYQYK